MTTGYRIATAALLLLFGLVWTASVYGWGLPDDASARTRSVRQGSVYGRRFMGGGPGFGK